MIIESLQLYSRDVKSLKAFYQQILGCTVLTEEHQQFELKMGHTVLRFEEHPDATPYHFALNIPSNQIQAATGWLREHVDILTGPDGEIVDFSSWKAKSVYFYDADQNIVELIARERIGVYRDDSFDMKQITGASEIGMPVSDIKSTFRNLCNLAPFPVFSGSFEVFCAMGDDEGLFIVIDKDKKTWFPSDDVAYSSGFKVMGKQSNASFSFEFKNGRIKH